MLMPTVVSGSAFILIVRLGSVHIVSGVRGCVLVDSRVRGIFIVTEVRACSVSGGVRG